ncbi:hypothetical protein [Peterkaempfera griseoplana]|uniref:hypothetical protein n=1 Tax=Peterkaempfera griseoplana TaxID=66896 RepID=UPI0006E2F624|nr:hypothetical protein [Peterkaempfera griseoplana]
MRSIRTAAAVVVVATLLGGTTACGGHRKRTPKQAFQAAAKVMADAGAAKVALQRQDPVDGASSGSGELSWGSKPAMALVMRHGAAQMQVRTLDGVVYLVADPEQSAWMGGRHWMRFDPRTSGGDGAGAALYSTWSEQLSPASDLTALAAVGRLQQVGSERLDDDLDTVHYRASASVTDMVGASSDLSAEQRASLLDAYRRQGATSITVDVWIDDKDQVVQERRSFLLPKGPETTSTRYSAIGMEVDIQAPLPDDTFDTRNLTGREPSGDATG